MLKIIKDLYTGAQAQLCINGKLGTKFNVTRGVAQGCALSPLLFDIYTDDLLAEFRKHKLGVPIGSFLQGALSFADDLALIAPNKHTAEKYIKTLENWCEKNFFKVE